MGRNWNLGSEFISQNSELYYWLSVLSVLERLHFNHFGKNELLQLSASYPFKSEWNSLRNTQSSNSFPRVFPEDSIVLRCAVEVLCVLLISACKTLRCTVPVCALTHVHTPFMCIVVSACMYICVRASYLGVRDNC